MSTLSFNSWTNLDGSENYKCRAWVNFNGTGTVAIRASGNVTSITDNGVGDYTVNFTTPMVDVNYCTMATAIGVPGGGSNFIGDYSTATTTPPTNKLTGSCRIGIGTSGGVLDYASVNVAIFR